MKRAEFDSIVTMNRLRSLQLLMGIAILYIFLITYQFPLLFRSFSIDKQTHQQIPVKPRALNFVSNLVFRERKSDNSTIYKSIMQAWIMGKKVWAKLENPITRTQLENRVTHKTTSCSDTVVLSGGEVSRRNGTVVLPCGLTLGSHVTVVGKPREAHPEPQPVISVMRDVMVSQFMLELKKVKSGGSGGGEETRVLHFNPRIKGDWSRTPVIEMNTCYRGQWGTAVRCEGWRSSDAEETVDGQVKCEKWNRDDDDNHLNDSKATKWLNNFMGQGKKTIEDWPFPFSKDKLFVLTVTTGLEGYHISVDGRHVASFPYRTGFDLVDATVLYMYGDVDIHSVYAASLPASNPGFSPHRLLEMSTEWRAPALRDAPIDLFIGILSGGDHFAERMAVRKSWIQHYLIKSSYVVARFFVALNEGEEVNIGLIKEAEFFGDIIVIPFMDNYDLVVLKTLAICEYGVRTLAAKYIMKCDDDTFINVADVVEEAKKVGSQGSFYVGKMNYYHTPLRNGKWAVTYEEWPEDFYPPYADGPGYLISSDIARFIVSEFEQNNLTLFKMEDVSMGMWVQQFNSTTTVEYFHSARFCQSGCIDDYYTAHYQSPKQMICLWNHLLTEGRPRCCNLR